MTAWFNGILGGVAAAWLGSHELGLSTGQIVQCLFATNLAGLLALVVTTLQGARLGRIRSKVMSGALRTWTVFLIVYFGTLVGVGTPLRDGRTFGWLVLPLILHAGFSILLFGPIQDRAMARQQRLARQKPLC
jgi:hypothetical protein